MNKTELIAAVAEKASISKKESEVVINAALDTIIDSLKNDEKVHTSGLIVAWKEKSPEHRYHEEAPR